MQLAPHNAFDAEVSIAGSDLGGRIHHSIAFSRFFSSENRKLPFRRRFVRASNAREVGLEALDFTLKLKWDEAV